jgi:hypothetical protein
MTTAATEEKIEKAQNSIRKVGMGALFVGALGGLVTAAISAPLLIGFCGLFVFGGALTLASVLGEGWGSPLTRPLAKLIAGSGKTSATNQATPA